MATAVFQPEKFKLDSGTEVTVKPLKIRALREFMKVMEKMEALDEESGEDESLNVLVEAAQIAVESCNPDLPEDFDVEDEFDLPQVYRIINVAGGIDLTGGNLTATQKA